jgi:hypothetical protein
VSGFIESLNNRFASACSDTFLTEVLLLRLRDLDSGRSLGARVCDGDQTAAYDAACSVFETILERACGMSINGHHVTQDFAVAMTTQEGGDQ